MLLATILITHLSLMNLFGLARAATVNPDACKCLDSISLPGFQTTFYVCSISHPGICRPGASNLTSTRLVFALTQYGTDGSARVPLQLSYNEGCK